MIVTVCELPDDRRAFERAWARLAEHVRQSHSHLVLLPDMPFSSWFADSARFDAKRWRQAVVEHDAWEHRLGELGAMLVLGSRPIDFGDYRYDEGFVWATDVGVRSVHAQTRLAGDGGERSWLETAASEFVPIEVDGTDIGFLIGPEIRVRQEQPYPRGEVDIVAIPRSTREAGFSERLVNACAVAGEAGAYVLSSNRSAPFEGQGWIIAPGGRLLGMTSDSQPFLSLQIDLASEHRSGPRYAPQPAPARIDPAGTAESPND